MTTALCPAVQKSGSRRFGNSPKRLGTSFKARMLNKDYREMLQCLLEENVRFLLVGAYAVAVHGFPRATKDIDFFFWATPENTVNLVRALAKFGAPLHDISEADLSSEGVVFQIGNSPRRIDIITNISAVKFEQAAATNTTIPIEAISVPALALPDL